MLLNLQYFYQKNAGFKIFPLDQPRTPWLLVHLDYTKLYGGVFQIVHPKSALARSHISDTIQRLFQKTCPPDVTSIEYIALFCFHQIMSFNKALLSGRSPWSRTLFAYFFTACCRFKVSATFITFLTSLCLCRTKI